MNRLLWLLYGQWLTDIATCYKAMPTPLCRELELQAERFELCAEMMAKVCRLGLRIAEVSIGYRPRTKAEGKKISWRDAGAYAWTLLKWRFADVRGQSRTPMPVAGPQLGVKKLTFPSAAPDGVFVPGGTVRRLAVR
jgi:hypothetical protein